MKPLILIVDDEAALVAMLRYNFEKEGYRVAEAGDGEQALLMLAEDPPDLVILDWMLPRVSGLEVCRQVKRGERTRDLPIIMLTARGEESDKIRGLDTGADDYVSKPFSVALLLARVRALLRRARPALGADVLRRGDVEVDLAAHRVKRSGRETRLGPTEYRLLCYFMAHPGRVFSREQLLDAVWGHDAYLEPRTVDVHIRRLRKALNLPEAGDIIRTVRSAGYSLAVE
ncbi:MAG: phosphate regulon transcriptional regulatory protein PhoB [Alphaproteobacteria bacterium]|nr:phosphate regulon transcriptional regulatory protein PhoB [Alphaproteobacteria bacterium]